MRFFYVLILFAVIMITDGLFLAALPDEAHSQGAVLGRFVCTDHLGHHYSVLGSVAGPAAAGGSLCRG